MAGSTWEYKVAYVDFRGRVSIEGEELVLEKGNRRSAFVRGVLDRLGQQGWELAGVHPLWPAETSYMIFKRPAGEATVEPDRTEPEGATTGPETESTGAPTQPIAGRHEPDPEII